MFKALFAAIYLTMILAAAMGWFMNIFQVVAIVSADSPSGAMLVVKLLGIPVAPLGAILGWVG